MPLSPSLSQTQTHSLALSHTQPPFLPPTIRQHAPYKYLRLQPCASTRAMQDAGTQAEDARTMPTADAINAGSSRSVRLKILKT